MSSSHPTMGNIESGLIEHAHQSGGGTHTRAAFQPRRIHQVGFPDSAKMSTTMQDTRCRKPAIKSRRFRKVPNKTHPNYHGLHRCYCSKMLSA